jgi:hypothetical protein
MTIYTKNSMISFFEDSVFSYLNFNFFNTKKIVYIALVPFRFWAGFHYSSRPFGLNNKRITFAFLFIYLYIDNI